jgi:hypothetical protein
MTAAAFSRLAAAVFGVVAVLQVARALLGLPVTVGATAVPVAFSWIAAVGAGALCVLGLRAKG